MWLIRYRKQFDSDGWRLCWDSWGHEPRRFKKHSQADSWADLSYGPFKPQTYALIETRPFKVQVIRESQEAYQNIRCDGCGDWYSRCSCRRVSDILNGRMND